MPITHTDKRVPRKLVKMVIDLRFTLAKDLTMTLTKADPSSQLGKAEKLFQLLVCFGGKK